ncbi:MAG: RHS repeat domain-containing protein [bacterium]
MAIFNAFIKPASLGLWIYSAGSFLLLILPAPADPDRLAHRDLADLSGPVKTVRLEESWYSQEGKEWREGVASPVSDCTFSREGIMTERVDYSGTDLVTARFYRETGADGRVSSEFKYLADGRLLEKVEYRYDDAGRVIQKDTCGADGAPRLSEQYVYNENGTRAEEHESDAKGLKRKRIYQYDEQGRPAEYVDSNAQGEVLIREQHQYDDQGRPVRSFLLNQDGEVAAYWLHAYDGAGRVAEVRAYTKARGLEMLRAYAYDAHGRLADLRVYGIDNHFISREMYDYEYDHRGNWIQRKDWSARENERYKTPVRVLHRTIEYFE